MAIKSQFNPIKFYTDIRSRIWDKIENKTFAVYYQKIDGTPVSDLLMEITFALDSSVFSNLNMYDIDGNEIVVTYDVELFPNDGYSTILINNFATPTVDEPLPNGYYYFRLTIDEDTYYYSDVFALTDELSDLFKVEVQSTPVTVGGYLANINTNAFYLSVEELGIKPKIEQVGQEQDAITRIIHGSRAVTREFEIDATRSVFIYLSALGLITANGLVTFSYGYETWTAAEITIEETTYHGDGLSQLKLSFVDESETLTVFNS